MSYPLKISKHKINLTWLHIGVLTIMTASVLLRWEQSGTSQGKVVRWCWEVWGYPADGWWGASLSVYTGFSMLVIGLLELRFSCIWLKPNVDEWDINYHCVSQAAHIYPNKAEGSWLMKKG